MRKWLCDSGRCANRWVRESPVTRAKRLRVSVDGGFLAGDDLAALIVDDVTDAAARLAAGQYDPTAVYVTTDGATWENWQAVFAGDDSLNFFVADSCYFMVPAV